MKKQLLFLIVLFSISTIAFAQSLDCKKTCTIDKVVHKGAFLGVQFGNQCHKEKNSDKGVVILKVIDDTAAADNNFKAFDLVIRINNIEVNKSAEAIKIIKSFNPFDTVKLSINRDGEIITKKVVLGAETTKIIQEKVCCEEAASLLNENNITVFPSPASENLNVSFKTIVQDDYKFGIFMANGVLIKEYNKTLDKGNLKETIPVNKMEDGVYILRITNNQTTFSKLFVVSKK